MTLQPCAVCRPSPILMFLRHNSRPLSWCGSIALRIFVPLLPSTSSRHSICASSAVSFFWTPLLILFRRAALFIPHALPPLCPPLCPSLCLSLSLSLCPFLSVPPSVPILPLCPYSPSLSLFSLFVPILPLCPYSPSSYSPSLSLFSLFVPISHLSLKCQNPLFSPLLFPAETKSCHFFWQFANFALLLHPQRHIPTLPVCTGLVAQLVRATDS